MCVHNMQQLYYLWKQTSGRRTKFKLSGSSIPTRGPGGTIPFVAGRAGPAAARAAPRNMDAFQLPRRPVGRRRHAVTLP